MRQSSPFSVNVLFAGACDNRTIISISGTFVTLNSSVKYQPNTQKCRTNMQIEKYSATREARKNTIKLHKRDSIKQRKI